MKYLLVTIMLLCAACRPSNVVGQTDRRELQAYVDKHAETVCIDKLSYLAYYTNWRSNWRIRLIPLNKPCTDD